MSLQNPIQPALSPEAAAPVERQNLPGAEIPSWWFDGGPCPDDAPGASPIQPTLSPEAAELIERNKLPAISPPPGWFPERTTPFARHGYR